MRIYRAINKIVQIEKEIEEIPYNVWTCFWNKQPSIDVASNQVSIGDSDYKTIYEMKVAIAYLAKQFGGNAYFDEENEDV